MISFSFSRFEHIEFETYLIVLKILVKKNVFNIKSCLTDLCKCAFPNKI